MAGKTGRSGGARAGAGRKRLPDVIKAIKGTARPKRRQTEVSTHQSMALKAPPATLEGDAADLWRYCVETSPPGLLHANNAALLERYCGLLVQYRAVAREVAKRPVAGLLVKDRFGVPVISPLFVLTERLCEMLRACEVEMGFTPAARSRVDLPLRGRSVDDDPWAEIAG